jgi:hypothetical protein
VGRTEALPSPESTVVNHEFFSGDRCFLSSRHVNGPASGAISFFDGNRYSDTSILDAYHQKVSKPWMIETNNGLSRFV